MGIASRQFGRLLAALAAVVLLVANVSAAVVGREIQLQPAQRLPASPPAQPQAPPPPPGKGPLSTKQFTYAGGTFYAGVAVTAQGLMQADLVFQRANTAQGFPNQAAVAATVDVYLRNEVTGQNSAATRLPVQGGRLAYTVTAADLKSGVAVYSLIVSSATKNSYAINLAYPRTDEARLNSFLMSLPPQTRAALQNALAQPRSVPPPPPGATAPAQAKVCDPAAVKQLLSTIPENAPQRCFGAIGRGCASQLNGEINVAGFKPEFVTTVNHDCTVNELVSVGSIIHDNCCSEPENRNGMYCSGDLLFNFVTKDKLFQDSGVACHREWRKAVYDVIEGRAWPEKFGPYYTSGNSDEPLGTKWAPRKAMTFGPFGVQDAPRPYAGMEKEGTRRLKAPMNQKLEWGDEQFCASGRFKEEHWCAPVLGCSTRAEFDAAKAKLAQADREKWWPVDPRRVAINAEIAAIDNKYKNRNQHWGICE